MAKVPKEFARVTKTKKPQHQLYQPGFNPANGCWLDGEWVTYAKEEWEAKKEAHVAAYQGVYQEARHYRDPAVPIDQLTPWQRQAYEHYAGQVTVYALDRHGNYGPIYVDMAGAAPNAKCLAWLRESGYRILPRRRNGYTGEITSQVAGYDFPADLLAPDVEPVPDPWEHIVKQNKARSRSYHMIGLGFTGEGSVTLGVMGNLASFGATMAVHGLVELEESIIRSEWNAVCGVVDPYADLEGDVAVYVKLRARAREVLKDQFDVLYQHRRQSHNECARKNLDKSEGRLFSFVLPVFNEDGTHEPWGERDVPWARVSR